MSSGSTSTDAANSRRRLDNEQKYRAVERQLDLAAARGEVLTKSAIARRAGVDRSIFYGNDRLGACFDRAISRVDDARRSSVESAARVTTATLRADLANEREFNRRLRTQVTALEARLSELLGQLVLADLPDTTRAAITGDRQQQQVDDLEHVVFQLREELRRRDEELDGVRRANRELTRRLNARHVDGPASDPAQP